MTPRTDVEIREELKIIDANEDVDVSSWEADFIEHVVFKYAGTLSDKQRHKAEQLIEKYRGK